MRPIIRHSDTRVLLGLVGAHILGPYCRDILYQRDIPEMQTVSDTNVIVSETFNFILLLAILALPS